MSTLDTQPVAVTVYPDRARITGVGTIQLAPGAHRLEISELTTYLDPDSARVSATGTAQARLTGTQIQRVYYEDTPAEEVHALEAQIETLADELGELQARIDSRISLRTRLEEVAGHSELFATALAATEMDIETQLATFDRLYQRSAELDIEIAALEIEKRQGKRRLDPAQKTTPAPGQRPAAPAIFGLCRFGGGGGRRVRGFIQLRGEPGGMEAALRSAPL